jgi:hypothetical protein
MNMKTIFLLFSAVSGAVPGVAVLATGIGTPPESKALFGGIMEACGAFSLLVLWTNRSRIKAMNPKTLTRRAVALVSLFLLCLITYVLLYSACVKTLEGETYFPLWTSGKLSEMVQMAGTREAALDKYGIDAVHEAIRQMPGFALPVTTIILLLTYEASFTFLTAAFALLAVPERSSLSA